MAETTSPGEKVQAEKGQAEKHSGRKVLIGTVVSNKMQKTIVVEVTRKKAHPMYKRVTVSYTHLEPCWERRRKWRELQEFWARRSA